MRVARRSDGATVKLCVDNESARGKLLIFNQLRNRLHHTRDAAQLGEAVKEWPLLHVRELSRDACHNG